MNSNNYKSGSISQLFDLIKEQLKLSKELKLCADRLGVTVLEFKTLQSLCERKGITLDQLERQLLLLEAKSQGKDIDFTQ